MSKLNGIRLTVEAAALRKAISRDFAKLTGAATKKIPALPGKSQFFTTVNASKTVSINKKK